MAIGKINGRTLEGGLATTELLPIRDPIFNNSSEGETYTDTAGDTYGTTASQTSFTAPATITGLFHCLSGHVNAGTGSFQVYNSTDAAEVSVITTSSTSEVSLLPVITITSTNINDSIILRLKNSGAGNTVTVDHGGIGSADNLLNIASTSSRVAFPVGATQPSAVALALGTVKYIPLKRISTATFTGDLGVVAGLNNLSVPLATKVLGSFTEADDGTIATVNPDCLIMANKDNSTEFSRIFGASAIGSSSDLSVAVSAQINTINI